MLPEELFCANHPDRAALEVCEVCGKPLCGYCLYYTSDGQRLCEIHAHAAKANGLKIIPPAIYANGIIASQAEAAVQVEDSPKRKGLYDKRVPIYQGNNQDLNAFLAMLMGVFTLASCCGAAYCLPFAAVVLGILALINAKDAIDPRRTRQQAWIGIFSGGCLATVILGGIAFYVFLYGTLIASVGNWNWNNYYTPYVFSTSTSTPPGFSLQGTTPTRPFLEPAQLNQTATANAQNAQESIPTATPEP